MATSNRELILALIKGGIYTEPDQFIGQGYPDEEVAAAFSLFEHEAKNVEFLQQDNLGDASYQSSNVSSIASSSLSSPDRRGSSRDSSSSSNSSSASYSSSSPSTSAASNGSSPTAAYSNPLSKRLGNIQEEFDDTNNNLDSLPYSNPLFQLDARINAQARKSSNALEILQEQTYEKRINELFEFVTNEAFNPNYKTYLNTFICQSFSSDINAFVKKEISAYVRGEVGDISKPTLIAIERACQLHKLEKDRMLQLPQLVENRQIETPSLAEQLETAAAKRVHSLYLYITNPTHNPKYKEHFELFREHLSDTDDNIVSRVRDFVESYVDRIRDADPSFNLVRKMLSIIEKEMNAKKFEQERIQKLHQFITRHLYMNSRDVPQEWVPHLEKIKRLDNEENNAFNQRLLVLAEHFVTRKSRLPIQQCVALYYLESHMNDIEARSQLEPGAEQVLKERVKFS